MKKLVITALLVCASIQLNAMNHGDELITFKGEEKYLLGWIRTSQLDHHHRFSTTAIFRYNTETHTFTEHGDILSLTVRDLLDIGDNNYVYTSVYAPIETRLYRIETPGAIILGTTNKELVDQLRWHHRFKRLIFPPFTRQIFMGTIHNSINLPS